MTTVVKAPAVPVKATHCLFDMDGLLLNTEDKYTEVSQLILERFGQKYEMSLKLKLMGRREDEAAEIFVRETGVSLTPNEYLAERRRLHIEVFPTCTPLPGVVRLVTHLRQLAIPMAVATSSHRDMYVLKAQFNGALFDLFQGNVTTGDDAKISRGKPAPDIFLVAQEELGIPVASSVSAIVFEDAESGVRAGLAAGMHVVWVRDARLPVTDEARELEKQCFAVLGSLVDFEPAWIGLPAY
ncbi:HAD-like domain-containing protein [Blastocladiella britannica]|nr:HAD-like domain-containing protein [Blastocladiella britannica]